MVKGNEVEISMNTSGFSHRVPVIGKVFAKIQNISTIRKNRWLAKGCAFGGLHEVLIFCSENEGKIIAKKIKIFRGGLKLAI